MSVPLTIDTWSFVFPDREICLVFTIPTQRYKKAKKLFASVAKTFLEIEREERTEIDASSGYDARMAYETEEAARTPGWRALPTESRRFIIQTSAEDERFLADVIERLERSRDVFERDFPPPSPIDEVSIVRICGSLDEFQSYGGLGGGAVGYFNPRSAELVLFDAVEYDRNMTYAVMTHEAFHQYCYFLFDESEAHRWFDEGHGDYYGAMEFRGKRVDVKTRMPGGLDRLSVLRRLIRENSWAPLKDHLNYTHPQWQSKGVDSYAQSWSIVFMLRQGALGEVPRRVWSDEYAQIIPNYMAALHQGFQEAYAELRVEAEAAAKLEKRDFDPEDVELYVDETRKTKIWRDAIAASWGQIDLDRFQERWLEYADNYIND